MAATSKPAELGMHAPEFRLPGVDGHNWSIHECAGDHGLLVVFICNHCPYVKAAIERIVRDARELDEYGIGVVAINSNDTNAYPEDSFENMRHFAKTHDFPFPYLYDETQDVARAYGAACTPDFFGFNRTLQLQYRGRLDSSRKEAAPPNAPRELFEAMKLIAKTGQGPAEQIPSIGCSIKWRDAAR